MSPPPQPPTLTGLSADMYPHIMDKIIAAAPFASLLALRAASKDMCTRIDKRLVDHVLLWSDGRMASRLAPHKRLPRHDWDRYPELAEALRVVDIQSGRYYSFAPPDRWIIWDHQTITPPGQYCTCAWRQWYPSSNTLGTYFPKVKIPVLRRWGDHSCGKLRAHLGVFFVNDPSYEDPEEEYYQPVDASLIGCGTQVFLLPIPSHYQLNTPYLPTHSGAEAHTIIFRRRPIAPDDTYWLDTCNIPEAMSCGIATAFVESSNPDLLHVVLVNWEGDVDKVVRSLPTHQQSVVNSGYPFYDRTRDELLSDVKLELRLYRDTLPEIVEGENVLFLSTQQYRERVGETAFLLEQDDHDFEFPDDV